MILASCRSLTQNNLHIKRTVIITVLFFAKEKIIKTQNFHKKNPQNFSTHYFFKHIKFVSEETETLQKVKLKPKEKKDECLFQ